MNVVGITGRMGTGKSTLAGMISDRLAGARIMSFADPLRSAARGILATAVGAEHVTPSKDDIVRGLDVSYGRLLQGIGDGLRESMGADVWVKLMRCRLEAAEEIWNWTIIDDVRRPNEAELIKRFGGLVVRLSGPERNRAADSRDRNHSSERDVEKIDADMYISTHGLDLDGLRAHVPRIIRNAQRRELRWAHVRR